MTEFVVTWVDGRDPEWRRRKAEVLGTGLTDDREERYRDWDVMKYWFRGVESFAPWVRKVFFICGQEPPEWLNTGAEKLVVVRHEDYLPEAYRPTYNSNAIELNMHRIDGLGEQFVYFNDDMFLLKPLTETDFFENGLPKDAALLNPVPTTDLRGRGKDARIFTMPLNNAEYLNRDYDFRACMKAHRRKWLSFRYGKSLIRNRMLMTWPRFVGFDEPHMPQAFLKASFVSAWEQDGDVLAETSRHRVRDDRDVNHWLIRERQLAEGKFIPRSPAIGKVFDLDREGTEAARAVRTQQAAMVCLNDGPMEEEAFRAARKELQEAFEAILPERSGFERP